VKLQGAVSFIVWILACGSPALGDTSQFEGHWAGPQSGAIASVEIRNVDGTLRIHAFGGRNPQDGDWGDVVAQTYPGADHGSKDELEALSAEFLLGFGRVLLIAYPAVEDRLHVETFTVYTDSSGRAPCHEVVRLKRSEAVHTAAMTGLVQPMQLSPPSGSVFSDYPRGTTLEWSAVPGAAKYEVEVDCFHCCRHGEWCSEVGGRFRSAVVDGLTYTFNFVGAQPGRWRVWALGPDGEAGPKTAWWDFRYTR